VLSNDGLVYTCDRGNNRLQVFDKTGTLKRTIKIDPPEFGGNMMSHMAANDMAFSNDKAETFIFDTDIDTMRIWILDKQSGKTLGGFGRPGHQAGEFNFPHAIVTDSRGSLYISETVGGRRNQKFVKQ
jgi:sugar lactone lactonase YvrE